MKNDRWSSLTEEQKYASYKKRCKKQGKPASDFSEWLRKHKEYRAQYQKPKSERVKKGTEKKCLGCDTHFLSESPFNRMCNYCKVKS